MIIKMNIQSYETILKPAGLDEFLLQGAYAKIYDSALVILALEKFRETVWKECFPTIARTFILPFERRPDFEYKK